MAALTHVMVDPMDTIARTGARKFPVKMSRITYETMSAMAMLSVA